MGGIISAEKPKWFSLSESERIRNGSWAEEQDSFDNPVDNMTAHSDLHQADEHPNFQGLDFLDFAELVRMPEPHSTL